MQQCSNPAEVETGFGFIVDDRIISHRQEIALFEATPQEKKYGVWKAGYGSITVFLGLELVNDYDEQ